MLDGKIMTVLRRSIVVFDLLALFAMMTTTIAAAAAIIITVIMIIITAMERGETQEGRRR